MRLNKRGEASHFITKHMIYIILIAAAIVVMWLIIKGIINKLLTLY